MGNDGMPLGGSGACQRIVGQRGRSRRRCDLAGTQKALSIYVDLDAEAVDDLIRQLAEIRSQMLPRRGRTNGPTRYGTRCTARPQRSKFSGAQKLTLFLRGLARERWAISTPLLVIPSSVRHRTDVDNSDPM